MARRAGFSLVELLVVMAALALLLSLAYPTYVKQVDRARDAVLRHNLNSLREAIDRFYADHARYPQDLTELVDRRYLRQVPLDPVTDRADTWVVLLPSGAAGRVFDVKSGALGLAMDGSSYASW
jgi:general secretion pathway protein G